MRNLTRVFVAVLVTCFLAGPLHAQSADPNVVVKGYMFDNDTNGPLTTATKNVGVRILVTNNTANAVAMNNIHFGGMSLISFHLTPPTSAVPNPSDAAVIWGGAGFKVDNTYGSPSATIDTHYSQMIGIAILPVTQGQYTGQGAGPTAPFPYIQSLSKGMYLPQMHFVTTDANGVTTYYGVQTDPVTISS